MNAAQSAGVAGLETLLNENDIATPKHTFNDRVYRFKGTCTKEILTLFGTIKVKRTIYYDQYYGGEYYFPLDHALGIEKDDFATLDAREKLLFASSQGFKKAA